MKGGWGVPLSTHGFPHSKVEAGNVRQKPRYNLASQLT